MYCKEKNIVKFSGLAVHLLVQVFKTQQCSIQQSIAECHATVRLIQRGSGHAACNKMSEYRYIHIYMYIKKPHVIHKI